MKYIVSIFMLAYNQEDYIAQAIDSVLMQKTDFPFQLVIGEDCSTDRTREICQKYAEIFPGKIKLLMNEQNIGLGANYVKTYAECTGKYVAICDGDDYWIDPLKLQKQVDFLEKNPDYYMVFTRKYDLFPSGKSSFTKSDVRRLITSFEDLVFRNYIASVTVLFKNTPLTDEIKELVIRLPYGDWATYLLVLNKGGKIFFLDKPTAVYRKDFGTSTSLRKSKCKIGEINLVILKNLLLDENFKSRSKLIKESILKHKKGLMASYNKEKKFIKSLVLLGSLCFSKNPFQIMRLYLYSLKRSWQ